MAGLVNIQIQDNGAMMRLGNLSVAVKKIPEACLGRIAFDVRKEMRRRLSVEKRNFTQELYDSLQVFGEGRQKTIVGDIHGIFLETGTRPHFIPKTALTLGWAWSKMQGVPFNSRFRVFRSIVAEKGTQAHPFIWPAVVVVGLRYSRYTQEELEKIRRRVFKK